MVYFAINIQLYLHRYHSNCMVTTLFVMVLPKKIVNSFLAKISTDKVGQKVSCYTDKNILTIRNVEHTQLFRQIGTLVAINHYRKDYLMRLFKFIKIQ